MWHPLSAKTSLIEELISNYIIGIDSVCACVYSNRSNSHLLLGVENFRTLIMYKKDRENYK